MEYNICTTNKKREEKDYGSDQIEDYTIAKVILTIQHQLMNLAIKHCHMLEWRIVVHNYFSRRPLVYQG
jgi:hypothetical protein